MLSSSILSPPTNRARKKSRAGCKTCKLRKIKCDEEHPVCRNCKIYYCSSVEAKCEYEANVPNVLGPKKSRGNSGAVLVYGAKRSTSRPPLNGQQNVTRTNIAAVTWVGKELLLPKAVGVLALDPFGTLQQSSLPGADNLLHFFLSGLTSKCLPAGHSPEKNPFVASWWPMVRSDPFLFHVMLQCSAYELEWITGVPNNYHSERYAGEGIRLLRDRVKDPVIGICDETISAVTALAALEFGKKNMVMMKMHIDGLKKMVSLRGGIENIWDTSAGTANLVYWSTIEMMQESLFPPATDSEISETSRRVLTEDIPLPPIDFIDLGSFGIEKPLSELMQKMRQLCQKFFDPVNVDMKDDIHTLTNLIMQRLMYFKPPSEQKSRSASLTEACRYACAIFLFMPFNGHYPDPTLTINSFLHKLKDHLSSLIPCIGRENELLIWLLTVGGITAVDLPERDWFVGHLLAAAAELSLVTWEDLRRAMEKVIWIEKLKNDNLKELWEEVRNSAEGLVEQYPYSAVFHNIRVPVGRSVSNLTANDMASDFDACEKQ